MALLIVKAGLSTTVQDAGRPGYREWGVPIGGAFDGGSFALANALLGNPPRAAALEMTLSGGVYEAQAPLALALAGAPMEARVEAADGSERTLHVPQTVALQSGDRLVIGSAARGARTYLAVRGGWQTELVLGSRSSDDRLEAGVVLPAEPGTTEVRRPAPSDWPDPLADPLRVIDGPDARHSFDTAIWKQAVFHVDPQSDRMGLRLAGPALDVSADPERPSTPVAPGAVQVAGGQVIILGVSCGTMGGYPHVAHVISADLDRLAQARPGDIVSLRRVSLEEARLIDRAHRREQSAFLLRLAAAAGERAAPK